VPYRVHQNRRMKAQPVRHVTSAYWITMPP
jgi:hypothetical protein